MKQLMQIMLVIVLAIFIAGSGSLYAQQPDKTKPQSEKQDKSKPEKVDQDKAKEAKMKQDQAEEKIKEDKEQKRKKAEFEEQMRENAKKKHAGQELKKDDKRKEMDKTRDDEPVRVMLTADIKGIYPAANLVSNALWMPDPEGKRSWMLKQVSKSLKNRFRFPRRNSIRRGPDWTNRKSQVR